jgi:Tol biopolymer transport system component
MAIGAGAHFNHYEILAPLGAGGMGEVYRARDTRLDREVAIKVLPANYANDEDRLRRFEQEARATSALNHPNILIVHDLGIHEGAPYIVAELLEGEELRARLDEGSISQRKAIDYAQQIASGLAAAHARGIVHRDLKPENLFITKDDRVKILDFGLAKLRQPSKEPIDSQVATKRMITDPGTVMGTVGYMAPEQVRGQEADPRADIFTLGLILYEMLSGNRAFTGDSAADVMSAILKEEPPELGMKIAPGLEKVVRRCLEKKPEHRFHSAHDLGFALEAVSTPTSSSGAYLTEAAKGLETTVKPKRGGWRDRIAWIVAGVAVLAALALAVAYFNRSAPESRAVRLAFLPPVNLAFDNGPYDYAIVSPDGQKLAFTGRSADGKRQLWVRPLNSIEATPLPGTDDPLAPFWSPDSLFLGFGSQGKLKRIDLAGGRPQVICDATRLEGGTWSRTDVIVFAPNIRGVLFQVPATGGEPTAVTSLDTARRENEHANPCFLPDGRRFLYKATGSGGEQSVFAGSLDSKEVKELLANDSPAVYASPGWLLFVRNGALMAQAFDADNLELKGDAFPLTKPTNKALVVGVPFSVSENGVLIWQGEREREYQLVWFDRAGKPDGVAGPPIKVIFGEAPRLSPDGKRFAIHRTDPQTRNMDIWVIDLMRNLPTRLTTDPATDQIPIWSPDGGNLVFSKSKEGVNSLFQMAASGLRTEELLLKAGIPVPTDWSRDGRFIIYSQSGEKNRRDIWALPLTGSRQPYHLLNTAFDEYRAQLSPDGRWLAYVSDESGSYEVYVQSFTADGELGGDKARISTSGGNHPRFRRDGQELFYVAADGQMIAVPIKTSGATFEQSAPKALFKTRMLTGLVQSGIEYDVTADGQRFLIGTMVGEANASPVSVILNWTAEAPR